MRRTFNNDRRRQKPRQIDYEEDLIVGTQAPLAPIQRKQQAKNHRLVLKSQGYHRQPASPVDYGSPLNTSLDAKQGIFGGGTLSPWKQQETEKSSPRAQTKHQSKRTTARVSNERMENDCFFALVDSDLSTHSRSKVKAQTKTVGRSIQITPRLNASKDLKEASRQSSVESTGQGSRRSQYSKTGFYFSQAAMPPSDRQKTAPGGAKKSRH